MADKKSTVALCLPRAPHLRRFSSQAAPRRISGFAATSLRQLRARLERHIEPGFAPGMVGLVASGPEVETFVLGKMAFEGPDMRRDTIFRIASMTKPVTATAVMMLVEGRQAQTRRTGRPAAP
jgi:CubicO group peptidase (beta-lactamase class C family)